MTSEPAAIEAVGVARSYSAGSMAVRALRDASLSVARGEVVAIMGPSGSGKSTLLFLLAGLDHPNAGTVRIAGVDWATLRGRARAEFRRRTAGFIVQGSGLLPAATAAENVELPLILDGIEPEPRRQRVLAMLERVGLAAGAPKLPDELSGGEQQRVAIARALVGEPAVVLADEPTGSLDSSTAEDVTRLLLDAAVERGAAVVLVTHDPDVAKHADRVLGLHSGRLDRTA